MPSADSCCDNLPIPKRGVFESHLHLCTACTTSVAFLCCILFSGSDTCVPALTWVQSPDPSRRFNCPTGIRKYLRIIGITRTEVHAIRKNLLQPREGHGGAMSADMLSTFSMGSDDGTAVSPS